MAVEGIRLGPFTGGLNLASDPTAVQDTDLVVCENFELDLDGSLKTRPPIEALTVTYTYGGTLRLLGYFVSTAGARYLIASNGLSHTLYFDGTSWVIISSALSAAAIIQYRDKLWLLAAPGSGQTGGSWSPGTGFTTVSALPSGRSVIISRERMWIGDGAGATNGSQLSYSAAGDPTKWGTVDGGGTINVSQGDGQVIVDLTLYFSDILIFKSDSTYRFSYATNVGGGNLSLLSATVGAASQDCIVTYENTTYVLYKDMLYELVNYNFNPISLKVPFGVDASGTGITRPFSLSAWANRLIVNFFNRTYVYSLYTSTWSTWKTSLMGSLGRLAAMPVPQGDIETAYLLNNTSAGVNQLYRIRDTVDTVAETMQATARTKNYDYQTSHQFKSLKWWGADLIAKAPIVGKAMPIMFSSSKSHADLAAYTHLALSASQHGRMLAGTLEIVDPVSITGSPADRKFIKFLKVTRFRQIYFEVTMQTDGSILTSPTKLFTLTTFVGIKQTVSQKLS